MTRTRAELDTIREKVVSGHSASDKVYLVLSPLGRALRTSGYLETAENSERKSKVKATDGKLYLYQDGEEKDEIPVPQPFEMFGVRFERGVGVTDNKELADRIAFEFAPHYTVEEA